MNNFINISKGKYVKSSDYYVISNKITLYDLSNRIYPDITFLIGDRKPIRIIINAKFIGTLHKDYEFDILCYDKNMKYFKISYTKENFKKQYDGTNICTFDVSNEDCREYIEVVIDWGRENVVINNFTVEFNQTFKTFDYYSYKGNISKNIN